MPLYERSLRSNLLARGASGLLYNNAGALADMTPGASAASIPLWSGTAWLPSSGALAIGVTPTEAKGLVLRNSTPAALGAQQYSPSIYLAGQGWETGTNSSDEVIWRITNVPVQGAAAGTDLYFQYSLNGAPYQTAGMIRSTLDYAGRAGFMGGDGEFNRLIGREGIFVSSMNTTWNGTLQLDIASAGLGATGFVITAGRVGPMQLVHTNCTDAAAGVVFASVYDRNAASITNAATMRIHSFGWTNNADAYTELASVRADGAIYLTGQLGFSAFTVAAPPGTAVTGNLAYFSNGDAGSPCLAVYTGSDWLRIALGEAIAAS